MLEESRRLLSKAISLLMVLALSLPVLANQNWDGDNPLGNFSYSDNWYSNSQPSWGFSQGNLYFSYRNNGSQTSMYYDYGSWQNTNDIIWESTFAASLPLNGNGNGLNFNQRVENRSSQAQTVNIPLSGAKNGASQIELNPVNANLTLNAAIYNDNSKPVFVYGTNAKTLTLDGNCTITGASVSFTIDSSSNNTVVMASSGNSYGGSTSVNGGKLLISGTKTGSGAINVNNAAILGGKSNNGTGNSVDGNITLNNSSKLTGGDVGTAGKFVGSGDFTLNSGTTLQVDIGGATSTPGVSFDQIVLSGSSKTINLNNSTLQLNLISAPQVATYRIISATGNAVSNLFSGLAGGNTNIYTLAGTGSAVKYKVIYGSDYVDITFTSVPEPAGVTVVGGLWCVMAGRRLRNHPKKAKIL